MILKWILKDYASFKVQYRVFCCENGGGYSDYIKTDNLLCDLQQGESLQLNESLIVDYKRLVYC